MFYVFFALASLGESFPNVGDQVSEYKSEEAPQTTLKNSNQQTVLARSKRCG